MNDEQLGLGRVELVQQSVDGEGGVGRGSDDTEPMRSPGSDSGRGMAGSEGDTTVFVDVPSGPS